MTGSRTSPHEGVTVEVLQGPLAHEGMAPASTSGNVGAVLTFEGVVRPIEDNRPILGLFYEAYRPMAEQELTRLAQRMLSEHGLVSIMVQHSEGTVAAGAISFRLRIASRHRKEGLRAMEEFIDQMKRDVPIWKLPIWAGEGK